MGEYVHLKEMVDKLIKNEGLTWYNQEHNWKVNCGW